MCWRVGACPAAGACSAGAHRGSLQPASTHASAHTGQPTARKHACGVARLPEGEEGASLARRHAVLLTHTQTGSAMRNLKDGCDCSAQLQGRRAPAWRSATLWCWA